MAYIQERKNNDGSISYRVQVRLKGHPIQSASFKRKTDAKNWANQTESAILEGRHFKNTEAKKHTLGELIDRYIRDVLPTKPKSKDKQSNQLLWWKKEIGSYLLSQITPALIAEYRDKLLSEKTVRKNNRQPGTVNRYLAALSHSLTIAVKEWGWIDDSPMRKVTKPKEPRGRVRFLSDDERKALLEASKVSDCEYLYPVVVLALSTGMRQGEIMNLMWDHVSIKEEYLILHETKNNERRRVPIAGHALEIIKKLREVPRIDTNYVFPSKSGSCPVDIRPAFRRAIAAANIINFRFHDLRHTAASYLAMNGASIAEIAEILGHKTLQMVKRYAHISDSHTSKVVASMNKKIFGGING